MYLIVLVANKLKNNYKRYCDGLSLYTSGIILIDITVCAFTGILS